jgi:peptide deformylase
MSGDLDVFIGTFKHWRDVRGLSQSALASMMLYTRSYVSKIESGRERPSLDFVTRADEVLQAGGAIRRAYLEFDRLPAVSARRIASRVESEVRGPAVLVEHDDAHLAYDGQKYTAYQRRLIRNTGSEPITRYLIRISVDRFPGSPERSNQLYRRDPLTWEELGLEAWASGDERLTWAVHHDRDAFKELWLVFENRLRKFPLYPGDSTWISYRYSVSDTKWGHWFQRAVRFPTQRLSVRLSFPLDLDPVVWGLETSTAAQPCPFRTAIRQDDEADTRVFSWSTEDPPLHARYRLEWTFRSRTAGDEDDPGTTETRQPSEVMRALGIVQRDDPTLCQPCRPFSLPGEADDARRVVAHLQAVVERITCAHNFGKGVGLAAPQIGIDRSAALIRTPEGQSIMLLNPRVIEASDERVEHYEGCLSFFDVRGIVPRSRSIEVEHEALDGTKRITRFEDAVARLVAHEIDHLFGTLYTDRMVPGITPIPVEEYRHSGKAWDYR